MKKLLALSILFVIGLLIALPHEMAQSHSTEPPTVSTGAPGETTCLSCHGSYALNAGIGSISIGISTANGFKLDSTYTITVTVTDTTKKFGFELTALNNTNDAAGTFTLTNTSNTTLQTGYSPTRYYVGHKNASSNNTWTFNWKAPLSDTNTITFYACGVAANGDGTSSGDYVYTTNLTLPYDSIKKTTTGIMQTMVSSSKLNIYPLPATNFLNLSLPLNEPSPVAITLFDITGKTIHKWNFNAQYAGLFKQQLALTNLSLYNGLYIINVSTNHSEQSQKILIQYN